MSLLGAEDVQCRVYNSLRIGQKHLREDFLRISYQPTYINIVRIVLRHSYSLFPTLKVTYSSQCHENPMIRADGLLE